jgi:SprT-like family protein
MPEAVRDDCSAHSDNGADCNAHANADTRGDGHNGERLDGIGRGDRLIPTQETYEQLQTGYECLNRDLFGNKLPNCLITLQRRSRTYGYFAADRFARRKDARRTDEIALNPQHFRDGTLEILSTLAHEMKHLEQHHFGKPGRGRYHNREWAQMMKDIGLIPSATGREGGKETGDSVSHYIEPAGRFARVAEQLLASGFEITWAEERARRPAPPDGNAGGEEGNGGSKSGVRAKYTCPHPLCTLNAWAKPGASLLCGTHREKMQASG